MPPVSTRIGTATLLLASGLSACASSTDPSAAAKAVAAVSGDGQHGNVGAALAQPLRIRVTGSGGAPIPDALVTWTVTEGGGQLSSASQRSDPSGTAQVTWTLGPALGTQLVEARVGDLAPATFSATAAPADPCRTPVPYTLGTSVDGALAVSDCFLPDGSYIDYYSFTVPAVAGRRFTLASDSFDTFLFINNSAGVALALDNDGGDSTNASLQILLGPGTYEAGANSLDPATRGPYSLSSSSVPTSVDGCADIWISGGVKVTETITTTDCLDPSGPYYTDQLLMWLDVRQLLTVAEHSADFDALVGLVDLSTGKVVATDDDSGPDRDALMSYTATHAGEFVILATTFLADKTGTYTLDVKTPLSDYATPPSASPNTPAGLLQLIRARESAALRRSPAASLPR